LIEYDNFRAKRIGPKISALWAFENAFWKNSVWLFSRHTKEMFLSYICGGGQEISGSHIGGRMVLEKISVFSLFFPLSLSFTLSTKTLS
jgi:hypothetical protein